MARRSPDRSRKRTRPEVPAPSRKEGGRARWAAACADSGGRFWDEPGWEGAGRSARLLRPPQDEELVRLPPESVLQYLPGRTPLGWPTGSTRQGPARALRGTLSVAVQLPSGWTRTLLPAWERDPGAPDLPIFGYTAAFFRGGELWCAAVQTEENPRWNPGLYATRDLPRRIQALRKRHPSNRLLGQLEVCARQYGCYNAQNVFYGRWEGAAPVSPSCNACCRGCISSQPEGSPPSPQIRLDFVPTLEEIVELGVEHLAHPEALYSFGQGCEGEPLLQAPLLARAIRAIRYRTPQGTLHLNTNGSLPQAAREVIQAGLDSIRVSLNSAIPARYEAYYQPRGYRFEEVLQTIRIARDHGVWVSLNLLMVPGVNDAQDEVEALIRLLADLDINMVQMRNLNMDPDLFFQAAPPSESPILGVPEMLRRLRAEAPRTRIGNHNPAIRG